MSSTFFSKNVKTWHPNTNKISEYKVQYCITRHSLQHIAVNYSSIYIQDHLVAVVTISDLAILHTKRKFTTK